MNESSTFGQRLKALREERGYTQDEIAQIIGVDFASVVKMETSAVHSPRLREVAALADFFDVSIDYLAGRTLARNSKVKVVTVEVERPERRFFNPKWEESK